MGLQSDLLFSDTSPGSSASGSSSNQSSSTSSQQFFWEMEASTSNRQNSTAGRGSKHCPYSLGGRSSNKSTRCMVCGEKDHRFSFCTRTGCILWKTNGRFVDSEGVTYCFAYNGLNSCSNTDCPHHHSCSLCGDGQHSAQSCTAQ